MKIHSAQTSQLKIIEKPNEEQRSVWEAAHKTRSHMLFVMSKGRVLCPVTSQQQPQNKTIFKNRSHHVHARWKPVPRKWLKFFLPFIFSSRHICLDAALCCEEAQLVHRQDMLSVLVINEGNDNDQEDNTSTNILDTLILYRKKRKKRGGGTEVLGISYHC